MIGPTIIAKIPKGFVVGYELDLLILAISAGHILTCPCKISIEWDILKRETFPKGRQIVTRNKKALEENPI
ncbi:MAG: hypothetical protein DLM72_20215 [Candidatus Nitrosopolaris wilkensis]|nr:MAG: hypothetical protein DLM72_20215 [Candidatus Nitrosopolaris wilkensis]